MYVYIDTFGDRWFGLLDHLVILWLFVDAVGVVYAEEVRDGVKLRPEVLRRQLPATLGGDEVGNDSTTTHVYIATCRNLKRKKSHLRTRTSERPLSVWSSVFIEDRRLQATFCIKTKKLSGPSFLWSRLIQKSLF